MNGSLEKTGQLFKNGLILSAARHRLVELAGAILRLPNGIIHILREVGCDCAGDMRAARDHKSHRQSENAEPDGKPSQGVLLYGDGQAPRKTGQGDENRECQFDSVPD